MQANKKRLKLFDLILEIICIAILAIQVFIVILNYSVLPLKVPIYYLVFGEANTHNAKEGLLVFSVVNVILYVLFTISGFFPSLSSIPIKVTENNRIQLYNLWGRLLRIMKLILISIFFTQSLAFICDLQMTYLLILILSIPILFIYYLTKMIRLEFK